MLQQFYLVAPTEHEAREIVAEIKQLGLEFNNISLINERSGEDRMAHTDRQEFRNAVNGSIVGTIIGLFYGAAVLTVIGAASIPGILGACLILGYSALGGILLGAIVGSTGLFARTRKPQKLDRTFETKVRPRGIVINIELLDPKQSQQFMAAVGARGLADIYYSSKPAA